MNIEQMAVRHYTARETLTNSNTVERSPPMQIQMQMEIGLWLIHNQYNPILRTHWYILRLLGTII